MDHHRTTAAERAASGSSVLRTDGHRGQHEYHPNERNEATARPCQVGPEHEFPQHAAEIDADRSHAPAVPRDVRACLDHVPAPATLPPCVDFVEKIESIPGHDSPADLRNVGIDYGQAGPVGTVSRVHRKAHLTFIG